MVKASVALEYVETHTDEITAEEICRCTKIIDKTGKSFYLVANSRGLYDAHGIIEYAVRYNAKHGFTCTCEAGQRGFTGVTKHPSGCCQHVRAAIAASIEERKALAEQARRIEEDRRIAEEAKKSVPVEVKWNIPAWMLKAPVAPHMRKSPREL